MTTKIGPAEVIVGHPDAGVLVRQLASAVLDDATALIASAGQAPWAADAVPDVTHADLGRRRGDLEGGLDPHNAAGSGLFQWYFTLLDAARQCDRGAVRAALAVGPGTDGWEPTWGASSVGTIPGTRMKIDQGGPRPRRAADAYAREYSRIYRTPVSYGLLGADRFAPGGDGAARVSRLSESVDRIAVWWPEARTCLDALTASVTLIEGPYLIGGSDLACFGTTFLNLKPRWSVLCFADHLVHEAAHQALHATAEVLPPLKNPGDRAAPSPIRPDPRPLNGTLHATVVFSWLVELFRRALDSGLEPGLRDECNARLHRHYFGFVEGCVALAGHAEWTEAGRAFRDALESRRRRLDEELGAPDPAWCERIPDDYETPSSLLQQRGRP